MAPAPAGVPRPDEGGGNAAEGVKKHPWLWLCAFLLIAAGYFLLRKVDPGGRNAWSVISPALILAGYLLVIPAILLSYRR